MSKIAIIDDDTSLVSALEMILNEENHETIFCTRGKDAFNLIKSHIPDLIILDLILPDIDGIELCEILKADHVINDIPVIMLTARSEENEKVKGLKTGADDYMTKPFSFSELLARIEVCLRRTRHNKLDSETLKNGNICINIKNYEVYVNHRIISITKIEYDLLYILTLKAGKVLSREFLIEYLLKYDSIVPNNSLNIHFSRLRKKLGKEVGNRIKTVRGIGYMLEDANLCK